jgi:hypothetical protein
MVRRAAVIGAWPADHHHGAVEVELRVRDSALLVGEPLALFAEAERVAEPLDRSGDVLVRDHRSRPLHLAISSAA